METVQLDPNSNVVKISTNDFTTYANQEATILLKVASETKAKSDTLTLRIKFLEEDQNLTPKDLQSTMSAADESNTKPETPLI